jgi:hypothetical protein
MGEAILGVNEANPTWKFVGRLFWGVRKNQAYKQIGDR